MDDANKSSDNWSADTTPAQGAADKAKEFASDAKQNSSNATTGTIDSLKSQFDQGCEYLTRAINDEPVKAVVITAVVSSLITALLVSALRSDDRY